MYYRRGIPSATWWIIGIIVVAVLIAAGRVLKKGGYNPWKILIPFYGGYLLYKVANAEDVFWGEIFLSVLSTVIMRIVASVAANRMTFYSSRSSVSTPVLIVAVITGIIALIMQIVYVRKLAAAFGKGGGFAAGLFLLYPIFIMILGFGSAEYVGGFKGLKAWLQPLDPGSVQTAARKTRFPGEPAAAAESRRQIELSPSFRVDAFTYSDGSFSTAGRR